jgi:hypothetical protein
MNQEVGCLLIFSHTPPDAPAASCSAIEPLIRTPQRLQLKDEAEEMRSRDDIWNSPR